MNAPLAMPTTMTNKPMATRSSTRVNPPLLSSCFILLPVEKMIFHIYFEFPSAPRPTHDGVHAHFLASAQRGEHNFPLKNSGATGSVSVPTGRGIQEDQAVIVGLRRQVIVVHFIFSGIQPPVPRRT